MSTDWHADNNEYLAAALNWLRLTLLRHGSLTRQPARAVPSAAVAPAAVPEHEDPPVRDAGADPVEVSPTSVVTAPHGPRRHWWRRRRDGQPVPASGAPPASGSGAQPVPTGLPSPIARAAIEQYSQIVTAEEVAAAHAAMDAAAKIDPPPALVALGEKLAMASFEQELLLLCVAMELDPAIGSLCARVQRDERLAHPTFALALAMFEDATWDALSPQRPLRYAKLIEITQAPGQPLTSSALRADERVVNYVKGLNYLDDRLEPLVTPVVVAPGELPPSQQAAIEDVLRGWAHASALGEPTVVQLLGPDASSKRAIAAAVADRIGRQLHRMPVELLPSDPSALESLARLWWRENMLLPLALYLDADELDDSTETRTSHPVGRFLSMSGGPFMLATREAWRETGSAGLAVDVSRPTPPEQRQAWVTALGGDAAEVADTLTGQFDFDVATIRGIAHTVHPAAGAADRDEHLRALWDACVATTRPRMDALAQRIDSPATWDQLVLPQRELDLLHEIADQVRGRTTVYSDWGFAERDDTGLGISALLAGPPGSGKSTTARVLANDLRLSLYRIDLSAVVSKYIGETEKNLRRLFDSAEQGAAVLFFDEADALFGKRSEVKDSHDRYANIEVNYLLQRMESYRGVALLATNMRSALDPAFLRRLRFVVNFPFPEAAERRAIWAGIFPEQTPTEDLDLDHLAKLVATGGTIRNIALNAAFRAARARTPVTMPLILDVARAEFRKLELPIVEPDFTYKPKASVAA